MQQHGVINLTEFLKTMEIIVPALIFLGIVGVLLLLLLVVYVLVKNEVCCDITKKSDVDYQALGLEDNGSDSGSFFDKPYLTEVTINNQFELESVTDFRDKGGVFHITSDSSAFSDFDENRSHKSVKTAPQSTVTSTKGSGDDEKISLVEKLRKIQKKKIIDPFVENVKVKISLMYSKSDMFLMLTVNEVQGIPQDIEKPGSETVRLSIALLPEKRYRSKTKYVFIGEETTIFNESFKFSNVSRETLFISAFRFRLYKKQIRSKELCLGEIRVHLADVAQRSGGFLTWRTFQRKMEA